VTPVQKPAIAPGDIAAMAKDVVEKLLFLMKIPATVQLREENQAPFSATLDIDGEELGLLIGRRGQTLATLQYMVSLIVSRKLKGGVRINLDVAGYKQRRQEELHDLALRIAELVKSTRRAITLEPMSPSERRIVHLALRDDPEVITQSVGEEENRKVIVSLRRR
jgi:spoIIIJ-associated protein